MTLLRLWLGSLRCWKLKGWRLTRKHKRGVLVMHGIIDGYRVYRCPRCSARWSRKARKVKP